MRMAYVYAQDRLKKTQRFINEKELALSVKIRLSRHGSKKHPYYRVMVADQRKPRDGRFIEQVGRYNPCSDPVMVDLDLEKIDSWIAKGAQPSDRVAKLVEEARKAN